MKRKMDLEDEAGPSSKKLKSPDPPTITTEEEAEEETAEHPTDPTEEEAEEEAAEHLSDPTEDEAEEEAAEHPTDPTEEAEEEADPAAETTVRTHASEDTEIRLTDGQARALQCNRPGGTAEVIDEDQHVHNIKISYGRNQGSHLWWDLEGFDAGYLQQNIRVELTRSVDGELRIRREAD